MKHLMVERKTIKWQRQYERWKSNKHGKGQARSLGGHSGAMLPKYFLFSQIVLLPGKFVLNI